MTTLEALRHNIRERCGSAGPLMQGQLDLLLREAVAQEREACLALVRDWVDLHLTDLESPEAEAIRGRLDGLGRPELSSAISVGLERVRDQEREACEALADRFAWLMAAKIDGLDLALGERASKEIAKLIRAREGKP